MSIGPDATTEGVSTAMGSSPSTSDMLATVKVLDEQQKLKFGYNSTERKIASI